MTRRLWAGRDEEGSTLLLTLGYALLAIALILVCVCATDLHIAQKRLDALADAAALAGADGFALRVSEGSVRAELDADAVSAQAEAIVEVSRTEAVVVSAGTPDGVSAEVTLAVSWHPPLFSPFVPQGIRLEATATSRTAFLP